MRTLPSVGQIWNRLTRSAPPAGSLLLVVDRAGWILDEVAREIRDNVPGDLQCQVVHDEWRSARESTIHFVDRVWAWSDGVLDDVHPSNRLIGLWWHGRHDSPEPGMQKAIRRLAALHPRFGRLQVTCSIAQRTLEAVGVPAEKIVRLPEGVNLS